MLVTMVCKIIPTVSDCLSSWNWTESIKWALMVMKVTNQKKEYMSKGLEQKELKPEFYIPVIMNPIIWQM